MGAQLERIAFSMDEAAEAVAVSRRMLYHLVSAGKLRTVKIGTRRFVPRTELERLTSVQLSDDVDSDALHRLICSNSSTPQV